MNKRHKLLALSLFSITVLVYLPALFNGFVWDDFPHIVLNGLMRDPNGLSRIWFHLDFQQYLPMQLTTFWLEFHLWGLNPLPYHALNILLHACVGLALWRALERLKVPAPWLCALIFLVHPINAETAAYVTERRNLLSALFYLSAVHCWLSFEECGRRRFYLAALFFFLLALLSKTVACSLPVILLLLRWMRGLEIKARHVLLIVPFFIIALPLALLTAFMEQYLIGARDYEWAFTIPQRILICGRALWFYTGKILWPSRLMFIYPRWNIDTSDWTQWAYVAGVIAVLFSLIPLTRRFGRKPTAALLFFGITIFPALGFANIYPQRFSFVADHFQYMAGIGIMTLATGSLATLYSRYFERNAGRVGNLLAASALPACLSVLLIFHLPSYKNDEALYTDILSKDNDIWLAHINLGVNEYNHGDVTGALARYQEAYRIGPHEIVGAWHLGDAYANLERFDEARAVYQRALDESPAFGMVERARDRENFIAGKGYLTIYERDRIAAAVNIYVALAKLDAREQHWDSAYAMLQKARALDAHALEPVLTRAALLAQSGRIDEALAACDEAARMKPPSPEPQDSKADIYYAQGNLDKAEQFYREALSRDPAHRQTVERLSQLLLSRGNLDAAEHILIQAQEHGLNNAQSDLDLGYIHESKGDFKGAAESYGKAMALEPRNAKPIGALATLCLQHNQHQLAIELYRRALVLSPKLPNARENLAIALAQDGALDEAIKFLKEVRAESPPTLGQDLNLARMLVSARDFKAAAAILRENIDAAHRNEHDAALAKLELAWLLATAPDDTVRNGAEAVRLSREAALLVADKVRALIVTAAAAAESGDFPAAVVAINQAGDAIAKTADSQLTATLAEQRKLYESKQPFHGR